VHLSSEIGLVRAHEHSALVITLCQQIKRCGRVAEGSRSAIVFERAHGPGLAPPSAMSNASKRGEGAAEELGGKIKKGVGKVIGNEQMEAEGIVKEKKGEAKQEAAKASERTKGKVEEIVGAVKNRVGAVIDSEEMQSEGKAKELEGEARQKANE
jgi:uncharacterized protein YjbJ (UPF0337 family)